MLSLVNVVVAIGKTPDETLAGFVAARQIPAPTVASDDLPTGEGLAWRCDSAEGPVRFRGVVPREERRRHRRKYAEGELPPDRSFYFRGPGREAQPPGAEPEDLPPGRRRGGCGDMASPLRQWGHRRWLREAIKDPELADEVAALARQRLTGEESRQQVRALIQERYTEAP